MERKIRPLRDDWVLHASIGQRMEEGARFETL
jgi:hypothetical protein